MSRRRRKLLPLSKLRSLKQRVAQGPYDSEEMETLWGYIDKDIGRAERQQNKADAKSDELDLPDNELDRDRQSNIDDPPNSGDTYNDKGHTDAQPGVRGGTSDEEDCGHGPIDGDRERPSDTDNGRNEFSSNPESDVESNADGESEPEATRGGHGRNGASAYEAATHHFHALLMGIVGALCETCGIGRMSRYREKLSVLVQGQPLFGAEVHHFAQARCRVCGAIIRAEPQDHTLHDASFGLGTSYIRYSWSACAMVLVMHYFAGMPFKRLESLQAGWGIPMPHSNQWSLADACADHLAPLCKALEKYAIRNALSLKIDDTGSMVIQLQRQIKKEIADLEAAGASAQDVRTGINATGVHLETPKGKVLLFFTGLHHAGEIIDQLMKHRANAMSCDGRLVKVTDAASKNFSHAHDDDFDEAVCNAHAYLKFRGVKDKYPQEHALAGEVYKKVFEIDDVTRARGMTPHERMNYHRKHSLPEMIRLAQMCREKIQSRLVEPNSPLWEPLNFIINQWDRLTKFCHVPGVPLDTNVVEQMLIIPVRYLAGSFNYKTTNGAEVGDIHMSLIACANANGVEPVAYLTHCLEHHEDLARRPEYYFPWTYRERLDGRKQPKQTGPPRSAAAPDPNEKSKSIEHPLRPGKYRDAWGRVERSAQSAAATPPVRGIGAAHT